ncbi:MAG: hypothetical protein QM768_21850 [Agriterribacter sp.]
MRVVKVLYQQTITDIAIQEMGDAGRAIEIAALNELSLTDELTPGQELQLPDYDITKTDVVQLFTNRALAPASMDDAMSLDEGIDFWAIGIDFEVQ